MSEKRNNCGSWTAAGRELYEGKVGVEAVARVGRNQNLKGIIHEVLVKDAFNVNPLNWIAGKTASLAKSSTAVRDDVLIRQAGKIVGRAQLKDTTASIYDTIRQVLSGKYRGTSLVGTKETAKAFNAIAIRKGIPQRMTSSGFSSADTGRIAIKTLGSSAGKLSASAMAKLARSTGVVGAAVSGGLECILSGVKWAKGEIDGGEFAGNVARETFGGGLAAGAGAVAGTAASAGAATLLAGATFTAPLWAPAAVGFGAAVGVGCAVKGLWDCLFD